LNNFKQIWTLFKKDLLLEIRQQYAFYGVLLYVGATIFVLYMAIDNPATAIWNGLFWIIQLFISINAVAKSFLQENRNRMFYYHTIASPQNFILAKLLFNSVLMSCIYIFSSSSRKGATECRHHGHSWIPYNSSPAFNTHAGFYRSVCNHHPSTGG
jgi:heme exporter protein B